jgi:hypothetical protein
MIWLLVVVLARLQQKPSILTLPESESAHFARRYGVRVTGEIQARIDPHCFLSCGSVAELPDEPIDYLIAGGGARVPEMLAELASAPRLIGSHTVVVVLSNSALYDFARQLLRCRVLHGWVFGNISTPSPEKEPTWIDVSFTAPMVIACRRLGDTEALEPLARMLSDSDMPYTASAADTERKPVQPARLSRHSITGQLDRMLTSSEMRAAAGARVLRFLVENEIAAEPLPLNMKILAKQVFGREEFEGYTRTVVSRMRANLARYYANSGRHDPIVITVPLRTLRVRFEISSFAARTNVA